MGLKPPFDPLRPRRLPAPQNPDVSSLQNENRIGVFRKVIPDLSALFPLEKTLVDLDFYEVAGLELLANFVKNGFG